MPRLIVEGPIVDVLHALQDDLERLRRLDPSSGACSALRDYGDRFTTALALAREIEAWVSTAEAANIRRCSEQAITKACRLGKLVCRKNVGVWEIHKDSVLADMRQRPAGVA